MSCHRHARSGRLMKRTATGTRRKGPLSRPRVLQDCLRFTWRSRRAMQPSPRMRPILADWKRELRPKAPLQFFGLRLGHQIRVRTFFEEVNRTMPSGFQRPPEILT